MRGRRWVPAVATVVVMGAVLAGPASAGGTARTGDSRTMAPFEAAHRVPGQPALPAVERGSADPGLDVSHWQGTIDWSQVAGAGKRFVWAKATEDQTFIDPNYASYRTGAEAQGLLFGAYHFARPDSSAGDAVIEADHFASVAAPRSGELLPVLDIEDSGGLSTSALIAWVQAFLDRLNTDIGVKAVIYSGPYFWRTSMGDTQQFATEGYPLWVANWGVPKPDVPAVNWAGKSWSAWQWTDCGSVPGVSGCVDLDWIKVKREPHLIIP